MYQFIVIKGIEYVAMPEKMGPFRFGSYEVLLTMILSGVGWLVNTLKCPGTKTWSDEDLMKTPRFFWKMNEDERSNHKNTI